MNRLNKKGGNKGKSKVDDEEYLSYASKVEENKQPAKKAYKPKNQKKGYNNNNE